jgi:GTPase involved in cell partitioning and DNA repair
LSVLKNEIKEYNEDILKKPYIVCVNKADLIKDEYDYVMISAKHGINVGQLLLRCKAEIEKVRK